MKKHTETEFKRTEDLWSLAVFAKNVLKAVLKNIKEITAEPCKISSMHLQSHLTFSYVHEIYGH